MNISDNAFTRQKHQTRVVKMTKIGFLSLSRPAPTEFWKEIEDLLRRFVPNAEITFYAALDEFTDGQLKEMEARPGDECVHLAPFPDGSKISVRKAVLVAPIQKNIDRSIQEGTDLLVLGCSEEYPKLKSKKPLVSAFEVSKGIVTAIMNNQLDGKLGLIVYADDHVEQDRRSWTSEKWNLYVEVGAPGDRAKLEAASKKLKEDGVDLIVLDGYGYTQEDREKVQNLTGIPVIAPRTLTARLLQELTGNSKNKQVSK